MKPAAAHSSVASRYADIPIAKQRSAPSDAELQGMAARYVVKFPFVRSDSIEPTPIAATVTPMPGLREALSSILLDSIETAARWWILGGTTGAPADTRDQRIGALEREVAALRREVVNLRDREHEEPPETETVAIPNLEPYVGKQVVIVGDRVVFAATDFAAAAAYVRKHLLLDVATIHKVVED